MKTVQTEETEYATLNHCNGCSLCLLVCPIWQQTRDIRLTPHGIAKATQYGATPEQLEDFIRLCPLCGACEPICPQNIDLTDIILEMRGQLPQKENGLEQCIQTWTEAETIRPAKMVVSASTVFLAGKTLREQKKALSRILSLLRDHAALAEDDGWDIAIALESGMKIPVQRLERFLSPLYNVKKLVISDGIFYHTLRHWLPNVEIISLGKLLSSLKAIREKIEKTDFYVIESRTYHADYENLVKYYNQLALEQHCQLNLDLQRIAIPTTGMSVQRKFDLKVLDYQRQVEWLLRERDCSRIVTENWEDKEILEQFTDKPVLHLSELAYA